MIKRFFILVVCMTIAFVIVGFKFQRTSLAVVTVDFEEMSPSEFGKIEVTTDSFTIGMIGDVLLHYPLYTYENYENNFLGVSDKLSELDFLLANVESMPAGSELGLSGYPLFNSPEHILRDLKSVGVDAVSMANNHSFDRGENGLLRSIGNAEKYGMPYIGVAKSPEDAENLRVFDIKGVRVGMLAYTYGMNGFQLPKGKEYLVSWIDEEKMSADVAKIKPECDLVVMSIHWGHEYNLKPHVTQMELARKMSDAGVDVIFGHHPHVLQPYEVVSGDQGRETHVFYSLGNFFSAQQFDYTNVGGIASVEVERTSVSGKNYVKVAGADFYPTAVVKDGIFKVVPLNEGVNYVGVDDVWVSELMGIE